MNRTKLLFLASLAQTVRYEGEDPAGGNPDDKGGNPDDKGGKTAFTQEDVNKFLADDRRKHRAQMEKLEQQLAGLSENSQLSEKERAELADSLEDVRKQLRTKEQQAAIEKRSLEEKYQAQLKEATEKASQWESRYTNESIGRALADAAVQGEAFSPTQIVELLRSKTKLVEGVPMVDFPDTHAETGESIVTQLSPADAVKRMKELATVYGNLFKSNVVPGVGGSSRADGFSGSGKIDPSKLSPAQYRKVRAENPELLGL